MDLEHMKADASALFMAGVKAADPHHAVADYLVRHAAKLSSASRIHIIAAGKGALPMVEAALDHVAPNRRGAVLAVTNYENVRAVDGARVLGASHPLPDDKGEAAANEIERIAGAAGPGEMVLCLISGGASALLPAPVAGVSLADKIATNDLLLKSGADIVAMNTVRKALSRLKGGGLARAIAPAQGLALILSDVPGDDLSIIASGPTVADSAAPGAALAVVRELGLLDRLPRPVRAHLEARAAMAPAPAPSGIDNVLVGANSISLSAMEAAAGAAGYGTMVLSRWLEGDVQAAAEAFHAAAGRAGNGKRVAILAGGETSVRVTGKGKGGRNQELALRFAALCSEHPLPRPWVFLSGGTDGRDGPTDAAGGLVDPHAVPALAAKGLDPATFLADNDAYHALKAANALLMTGATGTNVADLQVLLLG
ncbi:MAG: DUF4147 domain-containing protein [Devosia sp.]|uniref:glycerate kinase type-2 family protein n=1 Tax=Devosia sp. TaxID=1871048 RepID=UPI0024C8AE9F|nr:DUF4147 domain-containing protein [Devosia sp.]UYN99173.1 MAG: DUF4147 domain-containing protein [Devosia sp.]